MKHLFLSFFVLSALTGKAQSVAEANDWFDKYEYAKAASSYELIIKKNSISVEDYQQWCYSYFIIGEYKKCLPMADSLVKRKDSPSYFYYVDGYAAMALKDYEKAKSAFEKYKMLDDEYNVDGLISSCEAIPSWEDVGSVQNHLVHNNSNKADFSGPFYNGNEINFHEAGKDSLGDLITGESLENAELMVMRAFMTKDDGGLTDIVLPDSLSDAAMTSIAFFPNTNEVLITLSKPLEETQIDKVPHLYKAQLNGFNIENVELWKYSGYEDTSSTAHATINQSGSLIVFTKFGGSTEGADLFLSKKLNNNWTKPEPINYLNTKKDEMYPMFMGDTVLSFSSDGKTGYGGLDIFIAHLDGEKFNEVSHVKSPVNSFNDDFNFIYYSGDSARYSSNRTGGIGDDDIYYIKFHEPNNSQESSDSSDYHMLVDNWVDPIIYFEFDKFDMEKDVDKLDDLIAFMKKYENSTVTVTGHTDKRGTHPYNFRLGQRRADEVKVALIKRGVDASQIKTSTLGKTAPQFDCSNGCTEEQHALNRVAIIHLQPR